MAAGHAMRATIGVLMATALITAAWAWPNYLAYFNLAAGGSARGYRLLVDSSSDWGQELPALKRWLDKHADPAPVYLSYFGIGSSEYYGVKAQPIPHASKDKLTELKAGTYCISATMLQCVYITPMGKWCRQYEDDYQAGLKERSPEKMKLLEDLQFARLAAFLRHRKPDDQVNNSILIYRLTDQDLRAALEGPPAELYDTNEVKR